ncbi:hypothetical protein J6590_043337 [Homalodisca vitripennis]|nr:hypothetical protein J6590_043337 [Homalodisca vitripennis]
MMLLKSDEISSDDTIYQSFTAMVPRYEQKGNRTSQPRREVMRIQMLPPSTLSGCAVIAQYAPSAVELRTYDSGND